MNNPPIWILHAPNTYQSSFKCAYKYRLLSLTCGTWIHCSFVPQRNKVAVKYCNQCGDNFCASCFTYIHRRGRLRRHTFEPLVAMCHDCGERAQVHIRPTHNITMQQLTAFGVCAENNNNSASQRSGVCLREPFASEK